MEKLLSHLKLNNSYDLAVDDYYDSFSITVVFVMSFYVMFVYYVCVNANVYVVDDDVYVNIDVSVSVSVNLVDGDNYYPNLSIPLKNTL